MSKSLGNFVTIRELLETEKFGGQRWFGGVLRLAMVSTHYRQPIDWTAKALLNIPDDFGRLDDDGGADGATALLSAGGGGSSR